MGLPMFNIARASLCTCLPKYNINPYLGKCAHNCVYCYAIKFPSFTGPVTPRLNLKEEISRVVKRTKMRLPVMLSGSTDPYQPLERNYRVTRRCIEVLSENHFPILIVTKSDLVIRDIDLLKKTSSVVSMTITTPRNDVASIIEPNAPGPNARFSALKRIVDENIPAVVRIDPIIPSVNSDIDDLEKIVSKSSEIGVKQITASTMKMVKNMLPNIRRENPNLSRRLMDLYRDGEWIGGYKYLNRDLRRSILVRLKSIVEDYGLMFATCREGFPDLNTTICDGTAYCRITLNGFLAAKKHHAN
ncbi:MAG: radical SAM protein [Candidatus Bathyarchaeia archaeon]